MTEPPFSMPSCTAISGGLSMNIERFRYVDGLASKVCRANGIDTTLERLVCLNSCTSQLGTGDSLPFVTSTSHDWGSYYIGNYSGW